MKPALFGSLVAAVALVSLWGTDAQAVMGAELIHNGVARYGKFEARIQFAAGDGVVSTFFLWKEGSEQQGVFWNELDIEKVGPDCTGYSSNALYGNPESNHSQLIDVSADLCTGYHTHTFEWTPSYIAWLVDGTEVRRLSGADLDAFEANALPGMQVRFNIWVGKPDFGGNFSPSILPVHQYINWVAYSEYAPGAGDDGSDFKLAWREDFDSPLSGDWTLGNWDSPFGNSLHSPSNVTVRDGIAVLSLTEDNATPMVTPPRDVEDDTTPPGSETGGSGPMDPPEGSGGAPSEPGMGGANAFGGTPSQGGATVEPPNGQGGQAPQGGPTPAGGSSQMGGAGDSGELPGDPPGVTPPANGDSPGTEPVAPNPGMPVAPSAPGPVVLPGSDTGSGTQDPTGANPQAAGPLTPTTSEPATPGPAPQDASSASSDGGGCSVGARSSTPWGALGLAALLLAVVRRLSSTRRRDRLALAQGALLGAALVGVAGQAHAVASAELYTRDSYRYGKYEARINFPAGDGVVSSFFLWKNGSEMSSVFWNELDFEKIGAACELQLNSLYGMPESGHESKATELTPTCGVYHTYTFEWTPDYIAWFVDGVELRRDTGADAQAYVDNAEAGMQLRFNIWPGTAAFGGNFSPEVLPVHEFVAWVRYSEYTPGGAEGDFTLAWHESFDSGVPGNFLMGSWGSPLGKSTHSQQNVTAVQGIAVLSLTDDAATGFTGTPPPDSEPEPLGLPAPVVTAAPSAPAPGTPAAPGAAGSASMSEEEARSGGGCAVAATHSSHGWLGSLLGLAWLLRRARKGRSARR